MTNTLIQFRAEETSRIKAVSICERLGIDLATYRRMCMARLIQENGIPFSMKLEILSIRDSWWHMLLLPEQRRYKRDMLSLVSPRCFFCCTTYLFLLKDFLKKETVKKCNVSGKYFNMISGGLVILYRKQRIAIKYVCTLNIVFYWKQEAKKDIEYKIS